MMHRNSQKGSAHLILAVGLVVAVLGTLGYVAYTRFGTPIKTALSPSAAVARTSPGVVTSIQFASALDTSGMAIAPTSTFSSDKTVYVVAKLNGVKPTTRIAYTRYLNDRFVDNGSLPAGKAAAKVASFAFKEKSGAKRPVGIYKVKLYTNGAFEKEAAFTVK